MSTKMGVCGKDKRHLRGFKNLKLWIACLSALLLIFAQYSLECPLCEGEGKMKTAQANFPPNTNEFQES